LTEKKRTTPITRRLGRDDKEENGTAAEEEVIIVCYKQNYDTLGKKSTKNEQIACFAFPFPPLDDKRICRLNNRIAIIIIRIEKLDGWAVVFMGFFSFPFFSYSCDCSCSILGCGCVSGGGGGWSTP